MGIFDIMYLFMILIAIGAFGYFVMNRIDRYLDIRTAEHELNEINSYFILDFEKAESIINKIVSDTGDVYKVNNPNLFFFEDRKLNKEEIKNMTDYMVTEVVRKITPQIEVLIRSTINIHSEEDLLKYIRNKVQLYIIRFISQGE